MTPPGGLPRLAPPRRMEDSEERILPLINIVFLLLIFFMLAGKLTAGDPFEVVPARSARAGEAGAEGTEILLGQGGQLALDGEVMDEAALLAALAGRLESAPDLPVRLRADAAAPAAALVALTRVLRQAGTGEITLVTLPEAR